MLGHAQQVVVSVNKAAVDVAREQSCDKDTTGPPPEFSLLSFSQRSPSPHSYPVEIFLTCFSSPLQALLPLYGVQSWHRTSRCHTPRSENPDGSTKRDKTIKHEENPFAYSILTSLYAFALSPLETLKASGFFYTAYSRVHWRKHWDNLQGRWGKARVVALDNPIW